MPHSRRLPPQVAKALAAATLRVAELDDYDGADADTLRAAADTEYKRVLRQAIAAWNREQSARLIERPDTDTTIGFGHATPEGFVGPAKDAWS